MIINENSTIYPYSRGYQQNIPGSYGSNQGGYGGSGNPYTQGSNPQGGNPYAQSGYGSAGGYPSSGQQPYGSSPYTQNTGTSGAGYLPSQSGGYAPQSGGYPLPSGGYPGQQTPYSSQGGGYPLPSGGHPGQQTPYSSQGGGFGGPGIGSTPGGFGSNDPRLQRLNQVIQQYEINQQFAARLHALGNCEIVVLCDDSGSMNTPLQGSNQTRWDELKSVCY